MIIYLLKSALCLLILLLVHRLIFQREAIYQFNRFYLLTAVIGSFLIPLIEWEVASEATSLVSEEMSQEVSYSPEFELKTDPVLISDSITKAENPEKPFDWNLLLWTLYGLITLVFLIRFVRNINLLFDKISRNVHVQFKGETLVLLREESLPFSFLTYIFVSKDYFESGQLTDLVFAHERAHVRGRHSWDNLLIEVLLVPFWFHPGLYLARQAIKLNHEFIADQAALQVTPLDQYKNFLATMMLPDRSHGLASSLNFSFTKKRFEMMKRKTANSTKWIMILGLIPVLAIMVYIFSEKVTAQAGDEKQEQVLVDRGTDTEENEINILLRSDGKLEVDGQLIEKADLPGLIDSKDDPMNTLARISADTEVEMGFVAEVQEMLREGEVRRVIYENQQNLGDKKEAFYRNAYILVEDENMEYTHLRYKDLSEEQKSQLLYNENAPEKKSPSQTDLETWRNKEEYALWIDGKVISNESLKEYSPSDFVWVFNSRVFPNARSERFPQPNQVHLYSEEYYNEKFGPNSETRRPRTNTDTITITQRRTTWHKDISRYPDPTTAYLQKNARYEKLRNSGLPYSQKSQQEQEEIDALYRELNEEYSNSLEKRKKSLKKPIAPNSQEKEGQNSGNTKNGLSQSQPNSDKENTVYSLVFAPELQTKGLKEYLTHLRKYQLKANSFRHLSQPSDQEIEALRISFDDLQSRFSKLLLADQMKVQRVSFPYAKIEKDGLVSYRKFEDLSPEELRELGC